MSAPLVLIRELHIPCHDDVFRVELGIPRRSAGTVFLLRDNGNVVRGNALAFALREQGLGTAVCHLLTREERERAAMRRRIPVRTERLARRLLAVTDAVCDLDDLAGAPVGIVVSGTAATAALSVAALRPFTFDAIACRHAKVESSAALGHIRAATLFLAAAGDFAAIRPMTRAFQALQCAKCFEILPGASAQFGEGRAFAIVCNVIASWMRKHLGRAPTAVRPPHSMSVSSAITPVPVQISGV